MPDFIVLGIVAFFGASAYTYIAELSPPGYVTTFDIILRCKSVGFEYLTHSWSLRLARSSVVYEHSIDVEDGNKEILSPNNGGNASQLSR